MGRPRWQLAAWSANSGEVPPWWRWRKWRIRPYQAPTTRMRGGGGGEEHDKATNELADAFLRWRVSTSSLESRRLLLRSYGRAEEVEEREIELASG